MAVKKIIILLIIIIINERGCFACQVYIESATALSDSLSYTTTHSSLRVIGVISKVSGSVICNYFHGGYVQQLKFITWKFNYDVHNYK